MTFEEAYNAVLDHAAEGVDVECVYRDLGMDPEFSDDAGKLAVSLVIMGSGCIQDPVPAEVSYALKKAARNLVERGHVEQASPESAAASIEKMRHLI